nr:MAG: ORF1 [Torque teno midi virus]
MPFWWARRRKPWYGRWRYRRNKFYRRRKRTRRRRVPRRRNRRYTRRRHRRRHKVRRKLKKINIQQWQPDRIKKCKIKGFSCLVLGSEGRQMYCYTNEAGEYLQPKAPGGGGFGTEVFTLKWLYQQWLAHNNIWTASNENTDLCRYTGTKIVLYRHPTVDFIFSYDRMPPFNINKFTYAELQPQNMLLHRHKKIILSRRTNPRGKIKHVIKIGPPKQMITKWFFQRDFAAAHLFRISATACSFEYPRYGKGNASNILTVPALSTFFFANSDWAQTKDGPYLNIHTAPAKYYYKYRDARGNIQSGTYTKSTKMNKEGYYESIDYSTGIFTSNLLQAFSISSVSESSPSQAELPIIYLRYNPHEDDGHGNEVYLTSVFNGNYNKPGSSAPDLQFNNVPLWMAFWGYYNYLLISTANKGIYLTHMFVVKSPALHPLSQATSQSHYPILDMDFILGKLPWGEYLDKNQKKLWYPTAEKQTQIINQIVSTGPYVPKLNNQPDSTWELPYKYISYFKWGGPQVQDPNVEDPTSRQKYNVPDTVQQSVQISDPSKLHPETIFHDWDYRRGIITQTAIKRMSENLEIDSIVSSDDSDSPPKKRKVTKELPCINQKEKKIKDCLLSLCEEPICQETPQTLQQHIEQQQQQQYKLRKNLLYLLTNLKKSQRHMELQTGILE